MKESEQEALRWMKQALNDYFFVQWIRNESQFYDKGCFISQQAGEKALKACLYAAGKRRVVGHSLFEMAQELEKTDADFQSVINASKKLDRFYIPARYPNGLPGGVPYEVYNEDDLHEAESNLAAVMEMCKHFLRARGYDFGF